jgi:RNA polymerase sigma-70 factor, ECF subfamily
MGSAGPEIDSVASVRPHPDLPDFRAIYGEFQPKIHRYLTRLAGVTDAEDLTQEVFVRVIQALPGFRGESSVSTWVYRIATNAALDRLRSLSSQRADRVPPQGPGEGSGIEQELIRGEMQTCIRGYIEDLLPQYRSVVLLSEEAELPDQEIAEVLGISLETVKIRLHRARSRLRKDLGRGCTFYRDGRNELACEPKSGGVSSGD